MQVRVVGTIIKAQMHIGLTPEAQELVDKARRRFAVRAEPAKPVEVQDGK